MRVGGPYFHQPGGGEPFRQTFAFVQQSRDIGSDPVSFIEQEMPRLNCQSIDRPRHAMAAYPNDKRFAGGEVSYPQSRNGKLLRHRMNQHHIRHCRRLFHGKQRFEGEVFVRLVDNEQAVGTRQDELFQLPFPANLAGGIVGIANPYQPRLTRQSLRRKERFHPVSVQAAGIGIFAECGHKHRRRLRTESLGNQVNGFRRPVGDANLRSRKPVLPGNLLFERVGFRFGISGRHLQPLRQAAVKPRMIDPVVHIRTEVAYNPPGIFIQIVSVSLNHGCCNIS